MPLSVRDVILRSGRLHGCWSSGETPTADEAADALTAFNGLKRALFGTVIGPRLGAQVLTGISGQAETGGEYQIPPVAFTLAAPAAPRAGARFGVVDANRSFGAAPCTIVRGGRLIAGAAADHVLATAGANTRFWFRGDAGDWVLEADWPSLDSAIEFPDPLIAWLPAMLALALAAEYGAELRPDVVAAAQGGRAAFARAYGRRGRNMLDPPLGV